MPRVFDGLVRVDYGQFYLAHGLGDDGPDLLEAFRGQANGLCGAVMPGLLFLETATTSGKVGVTIDVHENAPPIDDMWEEIVEVPFEAIGEELNLIEMLSGRTKNLPLPPNAYRVRYCIRGMDQIRDPDLHVGEVGADCYHLAFWPAAHAPDAIIKQTSERAAYWNEWVKRPNQDVA